MKIARKIVKIDEEKCNGCGLCIDSCAEGAIQLFDGKARLVSEIYCDGLGACLGECPQDAISIEERVAEEFDEAATEEHLERVKKLKAVSAGGRPGSAAKMQANPAPNLTMGGCPGSMARQMQPKVQAGGGDEGEMPSQLGNWPVQLKLVSPQAPYFQGADLLIVADCVPFAYADFHRRYLQGKPVVIGCPKLDDGQFYADKLAEILKCNEVKSISVLHMEVPCCTGLVRITEMALAESGKNIPAQDVTVGLRGDIIREINL